MQPRYKLESYHMMESFNHTVHQFKSIRSHSPVQKIMASTGSTWDAKHMGNFLSKSDYSNQQNHTFRITRNSLSHRKAIQSHDHFFKTTKDDKNASKIGFTSINPLITNIKAKKENQEKIAEYLNNKNFDHKPLLMQEGNFKFIANQNKFRKTDPLTLQHIQKKESTGFQKQRMTRLIHKRHPHGMLGIDHPQNPEKKYYQSYNQNVKIRRQPNSHKSHIIDRDWKTKKTKFIFEDDDIYGFKKAKLALGRRFSNDNVHGYDIVNNRIKEQLQQ